VSTQLITEVADPRDQKRYYFHATPLRRVLTPTLRAAFWFFSSIQVNGVENLPSEGPVVLAANHMTNFDVFPMQFVLPRPIFFIGKEELFRNPILDWFLRQLGGFPVYRGSHDQWAISHAQEVLQHGQVLGIFPEGKRNKGTGLRPAKTGAARLALAVDCPIVPMSIHGSQYLFRRFPNRTRVKMFVGKPIFPRPGETQLALTDRLMYTLAGMLPPESRGVYSRRPTGFRL